MQPTGADVGFEALKEKVRQAEAALEAKERQATADFRQVKSSWRLAWTPGRIVIAGLVSGFVVGKLEPTKKVTSDHAAPSSPTAILPTQPARSEMARRIVPTVAATMAHATIDPMRCHAAPSDDAIVGSPPRIRSVAPATTAAWKKIPIV